MRKEEGNALILYPDAWPVGGRIGTESGLPVDVVVIDGGLELASDPIWVSLEDTTDLVRPNRFLGPPASRRRPFGLSRRRGTLRRVHFDHPLRLSMFRATCRCRR